MDIIRRNTDYALRAAVELAGRFDDGPVSARTLADSRNIPYQLACKLLQRLHNAGIVKSSMGPDGGFVLCKKPSKITVRQVVEAVQGPVRISRCLASKSFCSLSPDCPINPELARLQKTINASLGRITLRHLSAHNGSKRRKR